MEVEHIAFRLIEASDDFAAAGEGDRIDFVGLNEARLSQAVIWRGMQRQAVGAVWSMALVIRQTRTVPVLTISA